MRLYKYITVQLKRRETAQSAIQIKKPVGLNLR